MAFVKKTWADRVVQFAGRRRLTATSEEDVYDVTRAEGTVTTQGDLFNASNMNNLEARIETAFNNARGTALTGTLLSANWTNNAQTLTITGLDTNGYIYIVAPASTSFANWAEAIIFADEITTSNQITFHCTNVPSTNISVEILKIEVA